MFGGEPVNDDGTPLTEDLSGGFARGHYEQHVGGRGVDPRRRRGVGGRRLRPARPLVGPALLAGAVVLPLAHDQLRRGRGLRGLDHHRHATASERVGGMAFEDGEYHHLDRADDRDRLGRRRPATTRRCASPPKSGDREYEITGSVLNLIPLRNRRTTPEGEQLVTRISEGMTEWQLGRPHRVRPLRVPRPDRRRQARRRILITPPPGYVRRGSVGTLPGRSAPQAPPRRVPSRSAAEVSRGAASHRRVNRAEARAEPPISGCGRCRRRPWGRRRRAARARARPRRGRRWPARGVRRTRGAGAHAAAAWPRRPHRHRAAPPLPA